VEQLLEIIFTFFTLKVGCVPEELPVPLEVLDPLLPMLPGAELPEGLLLSEPTIRT
jgi:hypothetical protein